MSLPPYAALLGLETEPGETAPTYVMPFGDGVLGRPGYLQGGAIGGLLEMAALGALEQALGADPAHVKPVNVSIDFLRGGRDRPTRARGLVAKIGSRTAHVEAIAWQEDEARPIATARMNYLIVR